ncbi:ATP-binding protein [Paenibacillus azoreducens]|uniref:sensor histidine kinase n=1 Tax=Paenibacillus azoreducens TaxID=116718 RepID=UPI0039F49AF6
MSIKTRLLLSYIAMTVIPVILFVLVALGLYFAIIKNADGIGSEAFWKTSNERAELVAGIKFMTRTEPDRFTDLKFLKSMDEQLKRLQVGLVVMKNQQITFASPFVDGKDLYLKLQETQADQSGHHWGGSKLDNRFSVQKFDIGFTDRSSGEVYLLTDMSPLLAGVRRLFPLLLLALLVVIGLTNGILTFLMSRNLIKPLYALKHAAVQIKEGDLSHEMNLQRKDEIGELGAAFEEMRFRLNESIHLQLQYEENRKELISSISHDLKTPITGIKACVEGIQDGIAEGPKREKYIDMIAKKTDDMDRLIDELLLFSKLDLKRLPFHLEQVDLEAYMRDCAEELRLDPRLEGVTIRSSFPAEGPVLVVADREKLRRVIMNIIDNSLKYLDKASKEIRLELFDGVSEATVKITDNGAGIAKEALPYIFDRFYRAEPSRNTDTGGSGIGLAIVKQMVEGQGGKVRADSQEGKGTSIYFTLPKTSHGGEHS